MWTVWKVHEVDFAYRSSIVIYSCSQLRDRVVTVFRALGARDDLDVKVSSCETFATTAGDDGRAWGGSSHDPFDRRSDRDERFDLGHRVEHSQAASVHVRAMMPTELTPDVAAELDRDKSRRDLVSRMTGDPAASRNVPVMFPAQWQSVTLSRASIGLEPEECELIEQMSTGVLRQVGVRVVRRSRPCDPRRVSRIPPQLTAEVLVGIPLGSGTPMLPPGFGDKDPAPSAPEGSDAKPPEPATDVPPK